MSGCDVTRSVAMGDGDEEATFQVNSVTPEPAGHEAIEGSGSESKVKSGDMVVVLCDDKYARSCQGAVKIIQILCATVSLVCVTSAGDAAVGTYLWLPLSWHLRVFVFICTLSLVLGVLLLAVHSTSLVTSLNIDWNLLDFVLYSFLAFGFLFGSSVVASAADFYKKLQYDVSDWSREQLITAAVFGYVSVFLHLGTAVHAFSRYRQHHSQFGPHRFSSQATL